MNLVFRPARADDKPRVLAFTAHTWGEDDEDYIQYVYDEWLADPGGQFTAVELDGQPVAIGKLTDLGQGELWLEGLRVDPAHRRKGIGEALHDYNIHLARRHGGSVLRYATGEDNQVSRTFGRRTGFALVSRYRYCAAEASAEMELPEILSPSDWPYLQLWLDSPLLRASRRLYVRAWKWRALSEPRLRAHLEDGQVFGLRGASGLRAWAICDSPSNWPELLLQHLDGAGTRAMADMARAARRLAAERGRATVEGFALEPSPVCGALAAAGYRAEDHRMVVLELPLRDE